MLAIALHVISKLCNMSTLSMFVASETGQELSVLQRQLYTGL